jgi:hypothetical protein
MAIFAGIASMLGRFAGRVLNTTLGWATLLLFGKVPARKQMLLLVIVFGALVWVALIVGVLVPDVGALLIAAVPLPEFVDETWVRLAMLVGALITPLLIGAAATFIVPAEERPKGLGLVKSVLRGYPFSAVLTVTIVVLALVATFRKLRAMAKRWESAHVALIAKPKGYERVVADVREALTGAGLEHRSRPAGKLISGPPKLLDAVAGRTLGSLVPDQLIELHGKELEILVYPSDLAIVGTKLAVARARAAVVSTLTDTPAYQTSTAEAQDVEDEIQRLGEQVGRGGIPEGAAAELDQKLATLTVPFEDWDILYRQRLQLETTDSLAGEASGGTGPAGRPPDRPAADARPAPGRVETVGALALAALVAADIAVLLSRRVRGR